MLCPEQWVSYTRDLLKKYIEVSENIAVIAGGETRNETIMNGIRYIEEQGNLNEDTVVITHDAVRPFVTHRIIDENIECAKKGVACDTVVPATDTIVESLDKQKISSIPDRSKYYQGQTLRALKQNILKSFMKVFQQRRKLSSQMLQRYLLLKAKK